MTEGGTLDTKAQTVEDAFALCREPGVTVEMLETALDAFAAFFGNLNNLRFMRDAAVRLYDAERAKRAAQGLPPVQWSRGHMLPALGVAEGTMNDRARYHLRRRDDARPEPGNLEAASGGKSSAMTHAAQARIASFTAQRPNTTKKGRCMKSCSVPFEVRKKVQKPIPHGFLHKK